MKTLRLLPMAYALLLVTFVTMGCTHQRHQNEVDRIRSEDDVRAFLRKHGPSRVATQDPFLIKECDAVGTKLASYIKVDIDHNGQTDLIVNGREYVTVAMYEHAESYEFYVIPEMPRVQYCGVVDSIVDTDSLCFIYVSDRRDPCIRGFNDTQLPLVKGKDTLIGFEGKLVKYRPYKPGKRITRVRLNTQRCFEGASCPIFSLEVDTLGAVTYDAMVNTIPLGKFRGTIDAGRRSRIFRLTERIQPQQMDSVYMDATDMPLATLDFVFQDGSIKRAMTDGARDPGLRSLWGLLEEIRWANGWGLEGDD